MPQKRTLSLAERNASVADSIAHKRAEADASAKEFKKCFEEADNREGELRNLMAKADHEATEMRDCFRRSQEAYASGDGAGAKILSLEGRTHQRRAEDLNKKAQAIRDIGTRGKENEERCKKLNFEVTQIVRQTKELRNISKIVGRLGATKGGVLDRRLGGLSNQALQFLSEMSTRKPDELGTLLEGLSNPSIDERIARELPEALCEIPQSMPLSLDCSYHSLPEVLVQGPGLPI